MKQQRAQPDVNFNSESPSPDGCGLNINGRIFQTSKTLVMGALNLTPDSFYAQSRCGTVDETVAKVGRMVEEGADIIDMGAESTRPGSFPVSEEEETKRLMPALEECAKHFPEIVFSVDTTKFAVAERALENGASIINDISGLSFEPRLARAAAKAGAAMVLSHTPARPDKMQGKTDYDCVVSDVAGFLKTAADKAVKDGVSPDSVIVDPGIGFGKTANQNLRILNRLDHIKQFCGFPLLIGTSRKSFIGETLGGLPPEQRLEGTAATVAIAIMKGAAIARVHDVKEMALVAAMSDAVKRGGTGE